MFSRIEITLALVESWVFRLRRKLVRSLSVEQKMSSERTGPIMHRAVISRRLHDRVRPANGPVVAETVVDSTRLRRLVNI